jgi:hypothetical protein
MLRQLRNNTKQADRESNIYFFYLKLRQRGFSSRYLHRIMLKINLQKREAAAKEIPENKIIPFIIPFYRSMLTHELKNVIYKLKERTECTYLKIQPILAFKKTPNILNLCGGSGLSAEQMAAVSAPENDQASDDLAQDYDLLVDLL